MKSTIHEDASFIEFNQHFEVAVVDITVDYNSKGQLVGCELKNLFSTAQNQLVTAQKPNGTNYMINFLKNIFGGTVYDEVADAAYVKTGRGKSHKQVELVRTVVLDLDKKGRIVGLEILGIKKRVPHKKL